MPRLSLPLIPSERASSISSPQHEWGKEALPEQESSQTPQPCVSAANHHLRLKVILVHRLWPPKVGETVNILAQILIQKVDEFNYRKT